MASVICARLTLDQSQVFDSGVQEASTTFTDLLAPLGVPEFLRDSHRARPVHVPGKADKFAFAVGRDELASLLESTDIWTGATLVLAKDGVEVSPGDYSTPGDGPAGQVLNVAKVNACIADGAAMTLRDVATFVPGLKRIAAALAQEPGGTVQGHVCCSTSAGTLVAPRFDVPDLYVLQIAGRATWRLYDRPIPNPLAHPRFQNLPAGYAAEHRGQSQQEIKLEAGGLLYVPAGTIYEVEGSGEAALHAVFAVESVPTLGLISVLYEYAVGDELFRAALPDPSLRNGQALDEHLMRMAGRLGAMLGDQNFRAQIAAFVRGFRTPTDAIDLPRDARGG